MSRTCRIVASPLAVSHVPRLLVSHGMTQSFASGIDGRKNLCVQLNGKVIGWAPPSLAKQLARNLRMWKTEGLHNIPVDLEIGMVPPSRGGQYPGLYLFSTPSRMMRPVKYLANNRDDQVGSFEQVYMDIACRPAEIEAGISTHVEHAPTNFLSILANMTPFSDFNQVSCFASRESSARSTDNPLQSPRNIYQCQVVVLLLSYAGATDCPDRWVNNRWELHQLRFNIEQTTNYTGYKLVKHQLYAPRYTTRMVWIPFPTERTQSSLSYHTPVTIWRTP